MKVEYNTLYSQIIKRTLIMTKSEWKRKKKEDLSKPIIHKKISLNVVL